MSRVSTMLLFALLGLLASCGGGGGGSSSGGGAGDPNATWITAAPSLTVTGLAPADTTGATLIDSTGKTNAQLITALQNALNAGGAITFDTHGANLTITLATQLNLPQGKVAVIDGGGTVTLDGGGATRIIEKAYQAELTVQRLRFQHARTAQSGAAINVLNWDGRLTVIDCVFDDCQTTQAGPDIGGGAIRATGQHHTRISGSTFSNCAGSNGGAINSLGSQLTILNCSFSACSAFGNGGGADAVAHGGAGQGGIGGALYMDGCDLNADAPQLRIEGCTISSCTAMDQGGGAMLNTYANTGSTVIINASTISGCSTTDPHPYLGFGGGIYFGNSAAMTITACTFAGNSCVALGGGMFLSDDQIVRFANCTFSGNHAGTFGGAIELGATTAYLSCLTIADNSAGSWGAGLRVGNPAGTWLKNSVFANNTGTDAYNGHATDQTMQDGSGNLQWPVKRAGTSNDDTRITTTALFADPQLGPLQDNGGPTQTRALPTTSPAKDHGTDSQAPDVDQRGRPRLSPCDAGAFERQPTAPG